MSKVIICMELVAVHPLRAARIFLYLMCGSEDLYSLESRKMSVLMHGIMVPYLRTRIRKA
jgi:hypothetical protein